MFAKPPEKVLFITGGAGFIGSNFIRGVLHESDTFVINLDKLTYAGNLISLHDIEDSPNYLFIQGSIEDKELVQSLLYKYNPTGIINFAAESHVDRSIDGPEEFISTNVVGTFRLLEAARSYWGSLKSDKQQSFRFLHISTDEVFGSLGPEGFFSETTPYAPNSPYSASKAASDHLVRAYHHTYGLPTMVSNCSNNYGPYQFPEKLIPLIILNALSGKILPVYGDGSNIRDWLFVQDHCKAIATILDKGVAGQSYNIGGGNEKTNLEVVNLICNILDKVSPRVAASYKDQIVFVKDRPGHDRRYAIDCSKARNELDWYPIETFETGMLKTVNWYLENLVWCKQVCLSVYNGERLGLKNTEKES